MEYFFKRTHYLEGVLAQLMLCYEQPYLAMNKAQLQCKFGL